MILNFENVFAQHCKWAEDTLKATGSFQRMLVFVGSDLTIPVVIPGNDLYDNAPTLAMLRTAAVATQCKIIVCMAETWFLDGPNVSGIRPSQSEQRKEAIVVTAHSAEQERMSLREIIRDKMGAIVGFAEDCSSGVQLSGPQAELARDLLATVTSDPQAVSEARRILIKFRAERKQ